MGLAISGIQSHVPVVPLMVPSISIPLMDLSAHHLTPCIIDVSDDQDPLDSREVPRRVMQYASRVR